MAACAAPDGFVADATGCDDVSADVYPAAGETCDGRDEDCDGATDEDAVDAVPWYGYADAVVADCSAPAAHVADSTDCDDLSADVYPDAVETCDGRDEDCDGTVDEDGADASDWYADADGEAMAESLGV